MPCKIWALTWPFQNTDLLLRSHSFSMYFGLLSCWNMCFWTWTKCKYLMTRTGSPQKKKKKLYICLSPCCLWGQPASQYLLLKSTVLCYSNDVTRWCWSILGSHKTLCFGFRPNDSNLVSSDHKMFLQKLSDWPLRASLRNGLLLATLLDWCGLWTHH